jgi:signal transduction histidine kinase
VVPRDLLGDKDRLKQVIVNLIMNSIEATYQGSIEMDLKYNYFKQKIKFTIKDTGVGIKDHQLNQINNIFD